MEVLIVSYDMGDCGICCEAYNFKNHMKVQCSFCDFNSCRDCVQRYLVSTSNDPHCMSCKKAWNREFVDLNCTKVFRNKELKTHRETILVERERCLLPQTQELVARRKQEINTIRLLEECRAEQRRQRQLQFELENQIARLRAGHAVETDSAPKKTFVRKCPMTDCRGFLSDKWKCELCESKICKNCNELDGEGHECDPNNVETVKMLNKDTKPCPACGTMIFKISGCNQMWCPDCHTAFDWVSGRIETGVIHNPHFYEFQRRAGGGQANRNPGDIPCGGTPNIGEVAQFFNPNQTPAAGRRYYGYYRDTSKESPAETAIFNIHRSVMHIQNYEIPEYRARNPAQPDNSDLRVKYLMNEIDEAVWKKELQKREKAREKARDIYNILTMYSNTGGDYLRQMILREVTIQETIDFFGQLAAYFNETMENIHKRYNCVTPYIVPANYNVIHFSFKGEPRQ